MESYLIFYGAHSGQLGYSDYKLYQKAAETLFITLKRQHSTARVTIHSALSKEQLLEPLLASSTPIQQVHIICDSDAQGLYFEGIGKQRERLTPRASKWIRLGRRFDLAEGAALPLEKRTRANLLQEPGLLSGYLSTALDPIDLESLRQNHGDHAVWHIWGGNAGQYLVQFGDSASPVRDAYLKQFNRSQSGAPGIALDIAKTLNVSCTAVQGSGKWHAFGATRTHSIQKLRTHDRLPVPIWLWPARSDNWTTITPSGGIDSAPSILGQHLGLNGTPAHSVAPLFWSKPVRPGQGSGLAPTLKPGQGGPKKKPVQPTPLSISFQPNDSNTRAFYPKRNDPNHLAGKIKLKAVLAGTIPPNATYEWTVNKKDGLKFTKPAALETEILAQKAGKMIVTFRVKSSTGKIIKAHSTTICVPEFILIREAGQELKAALHDYGLSQHKFALIDGIKAVAEKHLSAANVRLVWKVGRHNQQLPKNPNHPHNTLWLHDADKNLPSPSPTLQRGVTNKGAGKGVGAKHHQERIHIYVGSYKFRPKHRPLNINHKIRTIVDALKHAQSAKPRKKNHLTANELEQLLLKIISRLNGDVLAHEVIHSLLPEALHLIKGGGTQGHNKATSGIDQKKFFLMNQGQSWATLSFAARTGILEIPGKLFPQEKGSFKDLGKTKATIHPLNKVLLNKTLPTAP